MGTAAEVLIEEAYRLFDGPTPGDHQACTQCCMAPKNHAVFFRVDRRHLPVEALDDWYHAAFGGPATPALRRYLLLRVMEVLLSGQDLGLGVELALERFETGATDLWSPAEQALIARFTAVFLDLQADPDPPWGPLDNVLCMFALAGHAMGPILDHVWNWPDDKLVTRLHADWCHPMGGVSLWRTAFWDTDRTGIAEASAEVMAWYRSQALRDRCFEIVMDDTRADALQARASCLYEGLHFV